MKIKIFLVILLTAFKFSIGQNDIKLALFFNQDCFEFCDKYDTIYNFKNVSEIDLFINDIFKNLYSKSFLSAYALKNKIDSNYYIVNINCNKKLKLSKLKNGNIDDEALKYAKFYKFKNNKFYNVDELTILLKKISEWYENNGFPFAIIKLDSIQIQGDSIYASLFCDKQKEYKINTIKNHGNIELNTSVLEYLIDIKENENYNEEKLKKIAERIERHNFIKTTKLSLVEFTEDSCKLNIFLDKKASNTFDGLIGFMPDYQNEDKINWTGELNLKLSNSFKFAEKLHLSWKKTDKLSQDLNTSIEIPTIIIAPFGSALNFKLHKADTSYIKIENNFILHYYKGTTKTSAYLKTESSSLLSLEKYKNSITALDNIDYKAKYFGLKIEFDNYDYYYNPSKGEGFEFDISAGVKEISKNPSLDEGLYKNISLSQFRANIQGKLNYYQPISKNTSLLISNKSSHMLSENLFLNEMFRIGGLNLMRGFDENFFFASTFSIQTLEYLLIFGENSRLSVFADKGYIETKKQNSKQIFRPLALGTGITFETKAGLFSIYYAIGKDYKQDFSFNDSKIHFGFVAIF